MPISLHAALTDDDIHTTIFREYADQATRLADTTLVVADKGKIVKQLDNGTHWFVTGPGPSPTFRQADSQGGGGSTGGEWMPTTSAPAPVDTVENDLRVHKFTTVHDQKLYAVVTLPSTYLPGNPVIRRLQFYSPSTSNNWKVQVTSTLIRKGVDAVSSVTNQHVYSVQVTNTSPADKLTEVTMELSDSSGEVNSVALAAGDQLKVVVERITPSGTEDTADLRLIHDGGELTFG